MMRVSSAVARRCPMLRRTQSPCPGQRQLQQEQGEERGERAADEGHGCRAKWSETALPKARHRAVLQQSGEPIPSVSDSPTGKKILYPSTLIAATCQLARLSRSETLICSDLECQAPQAVVRKREMELATIAVCRMQRPLPAAHQARVQSCVRRRVDRTTVDCEPNVLARRTLGGRWHLVPRMRILCAGLRRRLGRCLRHGRLFACGLLGC